MMIFDMLICYKKNYHKRVGKKLTHLKIINSLSLFFFSFFVVRTLKIYSLSNLEWYNFLNYMVTMLYISALEFISLINGSLCLLPILPYFSQFLLLVTTILSILFFYEFSLLGFHMSVR